MNCRGRSPLGDFIRSSLGDFKKGGGPVKLIGNALRNIVAALSAANDALYVFAVNSQNNRTFWSLQISKDLDIIWQRKHVVINALSAKGYVATDSHVFLTAAGTTTPAFVFIQSAVDGSTSVVKKLSYPGSFLSSRAVRAGADSIIVSATVDPDTSPLGTGHPISYFVEISSTPAVLNEFVIGKSGQTGVVQVVGVWLVDGADVYLGASDDSQTHTTLKTSHSGAIAWQKKVGASSPPVIAANAASSRVYLAVQDSIIALNSVDGSLVPSYGQSR